jgi:hypothetical protein
LCYLAARIPESDGRSFSRYPAPANTGYSETGSSGLLIGICPGKGFRFIPKG